MRESSYNITGLFKLENTYSRLFWNVAHLLVSHIVDPTFRAYWGLSLASSLEGNKGGGWVLSGISAFARQLLLQGNCSFSKQNR